MKNTDTGRFRLYRLLCCAGPDLNTDSGRLAASVQESPKAELDKLISLWTGLTAGCNIIYLI